MSPAQVERTTSRLAQDRLFGETARVLRPGGTFAGTDSRPNLRFRAVHLFDVCNPVDPAGLESRLSAAGFSQLRVGATPRVVHWAAQTKPTTEDEE